MYLNNRIFTLDEAIRRRTEEGKIWIDAKATLDNLLSCDFTKFCNSNWLIGVSMTYCWQMADVLRLVE